MDTQQALRIMQALADGVDPDTGEVLRRDSVLQSPNVIRALARSVEILEYSIERERERQRKLPPNAGKPWIPEEEAQICDELKKGMKFGEIAKMHNRTTGAIVARLVRLGKIAPYSEPLKAGQKQSAVLAKDGAGWSHEEDTQLCREFHDSVDFVQIAEAHGRSRNEVFTRLVALGKIRSKAPAREVA
jgi:hypothetical protein